MNYSGKYKPFQEPQDRCDRDGCRPDPCDPCNPYPKPPLCPPGAPRPCYPPFISPTPEIAEGMSVIEQVNVLTKKVNVSMSTYNQVMANCYRTLQNMECAAQENGAYYNSHEVWTEEGYSAEDSCPYYIIHKACVDRNGQPIRMDLHLAYGNTTNSQIKQDAFNASNVTRANILIPAIPLTGNGWYGNVFYNGAPLPSNSEPNLYTVGFTRSGVMNVYSNQITPDQMQRDCIVDAMGVSGVLAMQGAITSEEYRANIPDSNIKAARVVMGQNPETREIMILVCGHEDVPGMISLNCANILLKYGCTTIVEVCEGTTACAIDKGSMLFVPDGANVPETYAYWVISRECFYKNDYQRELADLTQNYGFCVWVNLLNKLKVDALGDKLDQEIQDRIDGDNNLDALIKAEEAARIAAVEALQKALDEEVARAEAAEAQLQANIDKEAQDRIADVDAEQARAEAAEKTLQDNITAEQTRAEAAEAQLQSNIDAEAAARQAADTELQKNITAEETARKAKDDDLQKQINTEVTERTDQVADLTAKLDKEVGERKGADAVLQTQVTANTENSNNALLQVGLLNTRVQTAEGKINQNITDIGTNTGAIEGLTTRVTNNETKIASNTGRIEALEAGGGGGEPTPDPELSARVGVLETDMTIVKSDVATNKTNIATNTTGLANLNTSVGTLTTTVDGHTTSIAANKTAIDANTAAIAALESQGTPIYYIGSTGTADNDGLSSGKPKQSIKQVVDTYAGKRVYNIVLLDNTTVTAGGTVQSCQINLFIVATAITSYTTNESLNTVTINAPNVNLVLTGNCIKNTITAYEIHIPNSVSQCQFNGQIACDIDCTVSQTSMSGNLLTLDGVLSLQFSSGYFGSISKHASGGLSLESSSITSASDSVFEQGDVVIDSGSTLILANKFWGINAASPQVFYLTNNGTGDGLTSATAAGSLSTIIKAYPELPVYRVIMIGNVTEPAETYSTGGRNFFFYHTSSTYVNYTTQIQFRGCNIMAPQTNITFTKNISDCVVNTGGIGDVMVYQDADANTRGNIITCDDFNISGTRSINESKIFCTRVAGTGQTTIQSSTLIAAIMANLATTPVIISSTVIVANQFLGLTNAVLPEEAETRITALETTAAALPTTYATKSHTHSNYLGTDALEQQIFLLGTGTTSLTNWVSRQYKLSTLVKLYPNQSVYHIRLTENITDTDTTNISGKTFIFTSEPGASPSLTTANTFTNCTFFLHNNGYAYFQNPASYAYDACNFFSHSAIIFNGFTGGNYARFSECVIHTPRLELEDDAPYKLLNCAITATNRLAAKNTKTFSLCNLQVNRLYCATSGDFNFEDCTAIIGGASKGNSTTHYTITANTNCSFILNNEFVRGTKTIV